MRLRHIAVGYDGSAASEQAVRWAVREAAGRDVMVLLVTACPPPPPPTTLTSDERLTPLAPRAGTPTLRMRIDPVPGPKVPVHRAGTALARTGGSADPGADEGGAP